jgi:putative RNA 2'-phosphotransferase
MPDARDTRLSRFLTLVLRHRPHVAGLELDPEGWVALPELVAAVAAAWTRGEVTEERVRRIVAADPKRRYELDTASRPPRIRASYGHSQPVEVDYPVVMPPPLLYHGTARRFLDRIFSVGLRPMGRLHVYLTDDVPSAVAVGRRRDRHPTVLVVDAAAMVRDGHTFHRTPGGLFLTELVPPEYLSRCEYGETGAGQESE